MRPRGPRPQELFRPRTDFTFRDRRARIAGARSQPGRASSMGSVLYSRSCSQRSGEPVTKVLRIFISSPGDVASERRRVALVIEKLAKVYARFFAIEPTLWEVEPMLASGHFQDNIIPPSATDIFILIVWSRLGTPLPVQTETRPYHGIDRRTPVTGTEWEFEDALAAHRACGTPELLAYRKQTDPTVSLKDHVAKAAAEQQWDKLNAFWARWFADGVEMGAAFHPFNNLDEFEDRVESDLRHLIERRPRAGGPRARHLAPDVACRQSVSRPRNLSL